MRSGGPALSAETPPRVVVVTEEPLGERMAGPAIRALELARALSGSCSVDLVSLTRCDRTEPGVRLSTQDQRGLRALVARAGSVVIQGDVLGRHPWLAGQDVALVVDAYDPFHLEQLEQARALGESRRRAVVRDCVRALNRQLARADLVLAASQRQRDLWLGHLAALGRVNPVTYDADHTLAELVAVVPFGIAPGEPSRADPPVMRGVLPGVAADDVILLWGGGIYDWFDPVTLVRAVGEVAASCPRVRLVFLGTAHPLGGGGGTAEAGARRVSAELGLTGRNVLFHEGWVPYDERGRWLAEADVGVSTHHAHVETEFSFRTRVLDYLWAGLPVVTTGGDALAGIVTEHDAGYAVPPGDVAALVAALRSLVADPDRRAGAAKGSAAAREQFRWPAVAAPLVRFCQRPRRAPDLVLPAGERALLEVSAAGRLTRVRATVREGGVRLLARRLSARLRPRRRPH